MVLLDTIHAPTNGLSISTRKAKQTKPCRPSWIIFDLLSGVVCTGIKTWTILEKWNPENSNRHFPYPGKCRYHIGLFVTPGSSRMTRKTSPEGARMTPRTPERSPVDGQLPIRRYQG
jgi:hypothetical protein